MEAVKRLSKYRGSYPTKNLPAGCVNLRCQKRKQELDSQSWRILFPFRSILPHVVSILAGQGSSLLMQLPFESAVLAVATVFLPEPWLAPKRLKNAVKNEAATKY